jgi:xanthine/uracil permease
MKYHWHFWALMVLLAAGVVSWLPLTLPQRFGSGLGVALAAVSGAIVLFVRWRALKLKGHASLQAGLVAVGASFVVRLLVLAAGLWLTHSALPFVIGFFALYFGLQVVEVRYLVTADAPANAASAQ